MILSFYSIVSSSDKGCAIRPVLRHQFHRCPSGKFCFQFPHCCTLCQDEIILQRIIHHIGDIHIIGIALQTAQQFQCAAVNQFPDAAFQLFSCSLTLIHFSFLTTNASIFHQMYSIAQIPVFTKTKKQLPHLGAIASVPIFGYVLSLPHRTSEQPLQRMQHPAYSSLRRSAHRRSE